MQHTSTSVWAARARRRDTDAEDHKSRESHPAAETLSEEHLKPEAMEVHSIQPQDEREPRRIAPRRYRLPHHPNRRNAITVVVIGFKI